MAGGAVVGVEGEEKRGEHTTLRGSSADGPGLRDKLAQPHALLPVSQEVSDPPAGGLRHAQLCQLVPEKSWGDGIECGAEVHKQDPGVGVGGVEVLEDEVESHVDCVVYRPVGSVGKLQWVEEVVGEGLEVGQHEALKGLHYYRGQGDWSVVIKACDPLLLGNGDDGGCFEAGGYNTFSQGGVEDVREHWRELVCTVPQCGGGDSVWSSCLAGVQSL